MEMEQKGAPAVHEIEIGGDKPVQIVEAGSGRAATLAEAGWLPVRVIVTREVRAIDTQNPRDPEETYGPTVKELRETAVMRLVLSKAPDALLQELREKAEQAERQKAEAVRELRTAKADLEAATDALDHAEGAAERCQRMEADIGRLRAHFGDAAIKAALET